VPAAWAHAPAGSPTMRQERCGQVGHASVALSLPATVVVSPPWRAAGGTRRFRHGPHEDAGAATSGEIPLRPVQGVCAGRIKEGLMDNQSSSRRRSTAARRSAATCGTRTDTSSESAHPPACCTASSPRSAPRISLAEPPHGAQRLAGVALLLCITRPRGWTPGLWSPRVTFSL